MAEVFQGVPTGGNTKTPVVKSISPSKQWCFTFNNYEIEKDVPILLDILSENSCKYVFQEEMGESGTRHLQGSIMFDNKVRPMSIFKIFPKIHWEKTKDLKASIKYCCKEESRVGNVYSNIPLPKPLKLIDNFREWQLDILDIIKNEPNDRTIHWYCDQGGGIGKSCFTKYLCARHSAIVLCGKASDMKFGIMNYNEKNGYFPELIIIDLPRTFDNSYLSYTGIEEIKNGCFYSPKYEGGMCLFNSPHIIIFSNSKPEKGNLSSDRWIINMYNPLSENFDVLHS
jgi:hypothetical protein